ncbi:hypothetical protein HNQ79_002554 [Streptomyces candidus]|uniref:Uncharacterized protein n=1 Tax=Streptomyces candidus TaxID=67283 RepID=A0A7X0HEL0_9ACTN|nr:hypothetical protein [Streptomyces candidus]
MLGPRIDTAAQQALRELAEVATHARPVGRALGRGVAGRDVERPVAHRPPGPCPVQRLRHGRRGRRCRPLAARRQRPGAGSSGGDDPRHDPGRLLHGVHTPHHGSPGCGCSPARAAAPRIQAVPGGDEGPAVRGSRLLRASAGPVTGVGRGAGSSPGSRHHRRIRSWRAVAPAGSPVGSPTTCRPGS